MDRRTPRPFESVANRGGTDIDSTLVERALAGDPAAEEELWRQIRILVVNLARIICKGIQDSDVDNVIQNSLRALHKQGEHLRDIRNLPAYLRIVITRRLIDFYNERLPYAHWGSLDTPTNANAESYQRLPNLPPGPDDVLEEVVFRELQERLEHFLATLPKEQVAVFRLRWQGCSYQEIAQKVGCPIGTVDTWIFRVRGAIRD
jgi:RNA polymerase sigma-70 factor (ECF subfamily)